MPYRFESPVNPYANTIGEMLLRRGDIAARQAELTAQAQARAAEIGGQAWAGAARDIGQSVAAIPQQIEQQKRDVQQQQLVAQHIEASGVQASEQKRAIALRSALSQAITNTPMADEGGVSVYDIPAITKSLPQEFRANADEVVKHLGGINDAFRAESAAKLQVVQRGATSLLASGADPDLTLHFIDTIEKNGTFNKESLDQFRQVIKANPEKTGMILQQFVQPQKPMFGKPGDVGFDPVTRQPIPGMSVPEKTEKPTDATLFAEQQRILAKEKLGQPLTPEEKASKAAYIDIKKPTENKSLEEQLLEAITNKDPAKVESIKQTLLTKAQASKDPAMAGLARELAGLRVDEAKRRLQTGVLSDAAVEQQAMAYLTSGQMTAMGMGSGPIRVQILNKAAELDPTKALALTKATFSADQASLAKITGTMDKVTAFESTAGKNLDQFLALAAKIPDTGVPWINMPVRVLSKSLAGSEGMAAADAARTVALREIARVTNDPNLTGVLSDSARKEVSDLSPTNATFAQIKAVAKVLKQDMANVHSSLNEQRTTIQGRLGGTSQAPTEFNVGGFKVTVKP